MRSRSIVVIALLLLLPAGCALEAVQRAAEDLAQRGAQVDLEQDVTPPPRSPVAEVVAEALPSVVNVKVTSVNDVGLGRGEGSGVVIDRDGVILTNFHVVSCGVNVEVVFNDDHGRMSGRVIGGIPERDLAVIRVDADDLTPISIGRSSNLRLGDEVIAIGFPLGLGGPSVTKGIVSALDREIVAGQDELRLEGLLQTDAAINPGNSGGALIDRGGRLVGINTAAAQAAAAENVGFAIAIDAAVPVIEEILSEPAQKRGWLGVSIAPVESAAAAAQLGVDTDVRGAAITLIFPDNPAEGAGLEEGDVIVSLGDVPVRSDEDLTRALTQHDPGDAVDVVVVNREGTRTVEVTLARRPPDSLLELESGELRCRR